MSDYSKLELIEMENKISELGFALSEANREIRTMNNCITIARYLLRDSKQKPTISISDWVKSGPMAQRLEELDMHDEEQERAFGQWEREQMGMN